MNVNGKTLLSCINHYGAISCILTVTEDYDSITVQTFSHHDSYFILLKSLRKFVQVFLISTTKPIDTVFCYYIKNIIISCKYLYIAASDKLSTLCHRNLLYQLMSQLLTYDVRSHLSF